MRTDENRQRAQHGAGLCLSVGSDGLMTVGNKLVRSQSIREIRADPWWISPLFLHQFVEYAIGN